MLRVNNLSFKFGSDNPVIKKVSFALAAGEHLSVMGESGCGKSTLLKLIYGLLDADQGEMSWKEEPILGPSYHLVPGMKYMKYVAQDFDLMPFTTVAENISKFLSRIDQEKSAARTEELMDLIGMRAFADKKVKTLSGGQQQRVALARALAKEPELMLLDEPFGQMDNFKKHGLRRKLFEYLKTKNIACIVATHDAEDALAYADKMLIMRQGEVLRQDSPMKVYRDPQSLYTGSLFDEVSAWPPDRGKEQQHWLYPNQLSLVSKSSYKGLVGRSYFKGTHWMLEVKIDGQSYWVNNREKMASGTQVYIDQRE